MYYLLVISDRDKNSKVIQIEIYTFFVFCQFNFRTEFSYRIRPVPLESKTLCKSLDRRSQDQLVQVGSTVLALYLSYYTSMKMLDMITPDKMSKRKALSILTRVGYSRKRAQKIIQKMTSHEFAILPNLVSDLSRLDKMKDVKGNYFTNEICS